MRLYGTPYMGSKSRFAAEIVGFLPHAPCLVDIFAGGCAVTHAALLSGKFRRIIANDISDAPQLFIDAANGKYRDEKRWIRRDDFFALKDTDPYVRLCWSFGNNGRNYLYSREVEEWKHALHLARVHGDTSMLANMGISSDGSRADIMAHHEEYRKKYAVWLLAQKDIKNESGKPRKRSLQSLQSLESLERLQRLESLESLERLETRRGDYTKLPLSEGCIVYCDPPYRNTYGYGTAFDHEAFYSWAEQCPRPVIISEYAMPEDRFACVWERHTTTSMAAQGAQKKCIERMFVPRKQIGMWRILTGTLFFGDC